jgi:hypothetical protein
MQWRKKYDPACYQPEAGLKLFDADDIRKLPLQAQMVARKPLNVEQAKSGGPYVLEFSFAHSFDSM